MRKPRSNKLAAERLWLRRRYEYEETTLMFEPGDAPPFEMLNLSR